MKKAIFTNGRWSDEECNCGHNWGNHCIDPPHKCTRLDENCKCKGFVPSTPRAKDEE